ncbi:hypothetical protein [Bradyrhizobium uaiense]|nr:hypothetical protein [Bradyrhizobium uaiense]
MTDIDQLPDPQMEQDSIVFLIWLEKPGQSDLRDLFMLTQSQKWKRS